MTQQAGVPVRLRRRNRRGESTRQAIVEATIRTLNELGYGATSVEAVMSACNLGRGSVLNQFPTRNDLMLATAEAALARMVSFAKEDLAALDDSRERIRSVFDIAWRTHNLPDAVATTEILLASRWDHALADALAAPVERIERRIDRLNLRLAKDAGITQTTDFLVQMRLLNSNMRGLTIELMFNGNRRLILDALEAMRADHAAYLDRLLSG